MKKFEALKISIEIAFIILDSNHLHKENIEKIIAYIVLSIFDSQKSHVETNWDPKYDSKRSPKTPSLKDPLDHWKLSQLTMPKHNHF